MERDYTLGMIQIPLSEAEFEAAAARLEKSQGITLTGNQGKISKMGVTAEYVYADGVLQVTILDKPFFVSTEYCEEQLKGWLSSHSG